VSRFVKRTYVLVQAVWGNFWRASACLQCCYFWRHALIWFRNVSKKSIPYASPGQTASWRTILGRTYFYEFLVNELRFPCMIAIRTDTYCENNAISCQDFWGHFGRGFSMQQHSFIIPKSQRGVAPYGLSLPLGAGWDGGWEDFENSWRSAHPIRARGPLAHARGPWVQGPRPRPHESMSPWAQGPGPMNPWAHGPRVHGP